MNILAKDYNFKSLLSYVAPTIAMMIFMSTYTIVDGLFVANLVGEHGLSAINIAFPVVNVILAIGLMFATGGTAIAGKFLGEGSLSKARAFLSTLYIVAIILGISISTIIIVFSDDIVTFLGATEELFSYVKSYLISISFFFVGLLLQVYAQSFLVLAEKPSLGFVFCFLGGIINIILDYFLISPKFFDLGIVGAGLATGIGNSVPAILGTAYFFCNKKGSIYFEKPVFEMNLLIKSMSNGVSELITQLSCAVTTILFNYILLKIIGEAGVTSITVILYIQMFQIAIYMGYSIGVAPIISYKFGAKDKKGLENICSISLKFIAIVSFVIIILSLTLDDFAVSIFISKNSETFEMAKNGLNLFSISYLFMGFNIFISALFTSLSNGKISGILSICRTLVFLVLSIILLPKILHLNGVWLAVPLAELLSILMSVYFYRKHKKEYGY